MRSPERKRFETLVAAVADAINGSDPIGLLGIGCLANEYALEIGTVVPRIAKASDAAEVRSILHDEFGRWFGRDVAGPPDVYDAAALAIWEAVLVFRQTT